MYNYCETANLQSTEKIFAQATLPICATSRVVYKLGLVINQQISLQFELFPFSGPRNSHMASFKTTRRRCLEIFTMPTRLGFSCGSWKRIYSFEKIQRNIFIMWWLPKGINQMYSSATKIIRKIPGCISEKNTEAIRHCNSSVFYYAILWNFCNATIHRTNFKCIRCTNWRKCCNCYTWFTGCYSQCRFIRNYTTMRKEEHLFIFNGWNISQLLCFK